MPALSDHPEGDRVSVTDRSKYYESPKNAGYGISLPAGTKYIPSHEIRREMNRIADDAQAEIPPVKNAPGENRTLKPPSPAAFPAGGEGTGTRETERPSAGNLLFLFTVEDVFTVFGQVIALGTVQKGGVRVGDTADVHDRDHKLRHKGAKVLAIKDEAFRQLEFINEGQSRTVGIILDCFRDTEDIRKTDVISCRTAEPAVPVPAPAGIPEKTSAERIRFTRTEPSHGRFKPYTGSGVCDVCNRPLKKGKAWIVPNEVFYRSRKYRDHMNHDSVMAALTGGKFTDSDFARMEAQDNSAGSAVCEDCIGMFE